MKFWNLKLLWFTKCWGMTDSLSVTLTLISSYPSWCLRVIERYFPCEELFALASVTWIMAIAVRLIFSGVGNSVDKPMHQPVYSRMHSFIHPCHITVQSCINPCQNLESVQKILDVEVKVLRRHIYPFLPSASWKFGWQIVDDSVNSPMKSLPQRIDWSSPVNSYDNKIVQLDSPVMSSFSQQYQEIIYYLH